MALRTPISLFNLLILLSCFSISSPASSSSSSSRIHALVAPVIKDSSTSLYTISLNLAGAGENFVIDINSPFLWSSCPPRHPEVLCGSPSCSAANAFPPPACNHHTAAGAAGAPIGGPCICAASMANPATATCSSGDLTTTTVPIATTDGHNPLSLATAAGFVSGCAPKTLFAGLPAGAAGVAGMSRLSSLAVAQQLSAKLGMLDQFALCLPGGGGSKFPGIAFFGSGPFFLLPPTMPDATTFLSHTPLLTSISGDYYISVEYIAVDGEAIPSSRGVRAKLSTTAPYTTLASSIYRPLAAAFKKAAPLVPSPEPPFEICFNSSSLVPTIVGYRSPEIDLNVGGAAANWTIFGANSLKQVSGDTACLAVIDGGEEGAGDPVVVGGFQMENNLLVFDLKGSTIGFSNLLFGRRTTCQYFNFTSAAAA